MKVTNLLILFIVFLCFLPPMTLGARKKSSIVRIEKSTQGGTLYLNEFDDNDPSRNTNFDNVDPDLLTVTYRFDPAFSIANDDDLGILFGVDFYSLRGKFESTVITGTGMSFGADLVNMPIDLPGSWIDLILGVNYGWFFDYAITDENVGSNNFRGSGNQYSGYLNLTFNVHEKFQINFFNRFIKHINDNIIGIEKFDGHFFGIGITLKNEIGR